MIELLPHDPSWASRFDNAADEIKKACPIPLLLFHIGSTAVPGLIAKPTIDIVGEVEDLEDIESCNEALKNLGFEVHNENGIVQRRYFSRTTPNKIHLHVFAAGDPQIEYHLRFRDYLQSHPFEAQEYAKIKQAWAATHPNEYQEKKNALIQEFNRKALLWSSSHYPHLKPRMRKRWTKGKALTALDANLYFCITYLLRFTPQVEFIQRKTISWVSSPVADDTFNFSIHTHLTAKETSRWIDKTTNYFTDKKRPFAWWVSPRDKPKSLIHQLEAKGYHRSFHHVGMTARLKKLKKLHHQLSLERIYDPHQLKDFCSIFEELGLSRELYPHVWSQVPPILYRDGAPFEIYVGYLNGEPVTTGMVVFSAQMAGIAWIATKPLHRHKGYAYAMMHHLLTRARAQNYTLAGLLASPQGKGLYEKFGFTALADFYEYSLK